MQSNEPQELPTLDERDATIPHRNVLTQASRSVAPSQPSDLPAVNGDEPLVCPACRRTLRAGELVCPHCQMVLVNYGKTEQLQKHAEMKSSKHWPTGSLLAPEHKVIHFEIFGEPLSVSIEDTLIVGRASHIANDLPPDVDLSLYGAGEFGVSRHHLRIRRRGALLYVTDLGSTNGTLLNGRSLFAHTERLLRDSDELYLAHLKVKVNFT
jgi:hypothetical protein